LLQGAANAAAVARRTFHSNPVNHARRSQEPDRAPVTAGGRGELGVTDNRPRSGEYRDVDGLGVRVDPADNVWRCCHGGNNPSCQNGWVRRRLAGQTEH
jgi:hypothetical protein